VPQANALYKRMLAASEYESINQLTVEQGPMNERILDYVWLAIQIGWPRKKNHPQLGTKFLKNA